MTKILLQKTLFTILSFYVLSTTYGQCNMPSVEIMYENKDVTNSEITICPNKTEQIYASGSDANHTGEWSLIQGKVDNVVLSGLNNSQLSFNFSKVGIYEIAYTLIKKNDATCPTIVNVITINVVDKDCSVTSLTSQKEKTTIYPNPFTNTIIINNISSSIDKIQLVDVYGNVIEELSNPSKNVEMGENATSGTYFIYLHSLENVEIQKVVKIN